MICPSCDYPYAYRIRHEPPFLIVDLNGADLYCPKCSYKVSYKSLGERDTITRRYEEVKKRIEEARRRREAYYKDHPWERPKKPVLPPWWSDIVPAGGLFSYE
jgi:hypothetical protein